jgi:HK97 gp10 family phage protein
MNLRATATYTPRGNMGQFIAAKVTPGALAGAEASANLVLEEAKVLVPVDTGELRESGRVETRETGKTAVADVEFTAEHASYVEFGTGIAGAGSAGAGPYSYNMSWPGMPAQPYLRPALDTVRKAIPGVFGSNIALSLKK